MRESVVWRYEGAPEVMEEVRAAVIQGYFRLARGGLEVGGLLLGRRDGGTLHIAASRPIPCQHAYGPAFTLSDSDLAGLAKLLEASSSEPELKGLVPVGWYHSHTRSDLELSDRDLEVHNRWFPEAWQVALVLRPERARPTRAAFYVRDAQGLPRQGLRSSWWSLLPVCAGRSSRLPPSRTLSPGRKPRRLRSRPRPRRLPWPRRIRRRPSNFRYPLSSKVPLPRQDRVAGGGGGSPWRGPWRR